MWVQATNWKLEEAIQLFYVGNEGGGAASSSYSAPLENDRPLPDESLLGYVKSEVAVIYNY